MPSGHHVRQRASRIPLALASHQRGGAVIYIRQQTSTQIDWLGSIRRGRTRLVHADAPASKRLIHHFLEPLIAHMTEVLHLSSDVIVEPNRCSHASIHALHDVLMLRFPQVVGQLLSTAFAACLRSPWAATHRRFAERLLHEPRQSIASREQPWSNDDWVSPIDTLRPPRRAPTPLVQERCTPTSRHSRRAPERTRCGGERH